MTPESDLRARVERGATFLDQAEPRWWKRVTEQLEMDLCHQCVLGQMFGGELMAYYDALDHFVPGVEKFDWAREHGFETDYKGGYDVLDRLWVEVIEARRADPDRYVP